MSVSLIRSIYNNFISLCFAKSEKDKEIEKNFKNAEARAIARRLSRVSREVTSPAQL